MAYTKPTAANFKARYPDFASVKDATVTLILDDADREVGPSWIEDDRAPAVLALTAHWLVCEGALGGTISAGGSTVMTAGPVTSVKVGDVETSFAKGSSGSGSSGSAPSPNDFASTAYGQRFLQLRRRSFPGVAIV